MRLSLIYCLFRGGNQIDDSDLRAALAFWNYADQSASYIFAGVVVPDRTKQKILECIGEDEKTTTQIRREAFSGHIDTTKLSSSLADLVANEVLILDQQSTGGAPVTSYKKRHSALSDISDNSKDVSITLNTHKKHESNTSSISVCPPPPPPPVDTGVLL